ncbi:MAG: Flp pilus assembly protein CpaB [Kiritimatiellia bacterium]
MKKTNSSNTKLAIIAAVLVGLFAIVAINKYIATKTAIPPAPKACIMVVTEEIASGGMIDEEKLDVAEIPFEALSNMHIALPSKTDPAFAGAFSDAKSKVGGRVAKRLVAARTPLFWIDVNEAQQVEITDLIAEEMRAVTLPVDSISSVCNFIRPGSRVDIVLTATEDRLGLLASEEDKGQGRVVSMVIMQNVPVLATDRNYQLGTESDSYNSITLNVPTQASLMLIQARTMGTLTYLLRNVRDTKIEADRQQNVVYPGTPFYNMVRSLEQPAAKSQE